ncbi:IclR family transcriptional regulator [Zafaria sp. Z1313]|uniref:IclR family transcriptional regulator n=1 Tax=Zafaria sp. Z1313 TaxID=3423202 RepID=UPI003D302C6D
MANSSSGESVLDRITRILGAFEDGSPLLTLGELSRAAGLPVSTTHRLAGELQAAGYLERDPEGRFGIGIRLWELAARSTSAERFRRTGRPVLEGVHAAVRQHVWLSVPRFEDFTVLYLERLDRHGSAVDVAEVAGRLGMHTTSAGLAMLAHAPWEVQERFLAGELERTTPATETDPARIRAHLAQIRERGVVRLPGVLVEENAGYAAPVFGPGNEVIGAITVVVPLAEDNPQLVLPVLIAGARSLSRSMGSSRRGEGPRPWLRPAP